MLDDQSSVLEAAQKTNIESRQIERVLHAARTWCHHLQSETEQTAAIAALVDRVELKCDPCWPRPVVFQETPREQRQQLRLGLIGWSGLSVWS
jgi:hypothetical protein